MVKVLQDTVNEALDVAIHENGYTELLKQSHEQVAVDLCTNFQPLEEEDVSAVAACVAQYMVIEKF